MKKRLPLTVVGGFLGAGKTTLLNHWLAHAGGLRMAVLVNDFGALNIDAALIRATAGDAIELSNGCVCCQIGDDLSRALIRVLDAAESFDAVVIEASGVSDPWRIAQLGRADPGLYLDGVVVVVSADSALAHARDPLLTDTLERQLKAADLIVINQCDLAAPATLEQVRRWITSVAGPTPQFETRQGQVPLPLLSGLALQRAHAAHAAGDLSGGASPPRYRVVESSPQHGDLFETWSCRPGQVFALAELRAWLRDPPSGLLRLKGFVRASVDGQEPAWQEIQLAGHRGSLHKVDAPAGGAALVAIGLRGKLPRVGLAKAFGQEESTGA